MEKALDSTDDSFDECLLKISGSCYELKPLGLDNRTILVLSNTRELDRDSFTNWSTLYTTTDGLC